MLMCHKVTQKNLIDSSSLFRVIVSKGDAENASNFSYQKPILALQENVLKSVWKLDTFSRSGICLSRASVQGDGKPAHYPGLYLWYAQTSEDTQAPLSQKESHYKKAGMILRDAVGQCDYYTTLWYHCASPVLSRTEVSQLSPLSRSFLFAP